MALPKHWPQPCGPSPGATQPPDLELSRLHETAALVAHQQKKAKKTQPLCCLTAGMFSFANRVC